ncbi:MAG: hypothetical protein RLY49_10 [Candidatus Parcubacteria bacterium]|jgi:hypothetical protein
MLFYICPTVPSTTSQQISKIIERLGHQVSESAIGASWFITTTKVKLRKVDQPFGVPKNQLILLAENGAEVPPGIAGFHIGTFVKLNGDSMSLEEWLKGVSDPIDHLF